MPRVLARCALLALLSASTALAATQEDAVAKAFHKKLSERIGHQWYARMEAHRYELEPATVHVMLVIFRDGSIRKLKVISNTGDQRVATLVIDAIKHSKIPQPPPAVLKDEVFEGDMELTVSRK
jgi:hypothetical protein